MWNAGVIGLPKQKAKELLQLSLQLCDEMCETDCTRRLIEQFSFSIALKERTTLVSCEQAIGHYWGNKSEWNAMISAFFTNVALKQLSIAQCVEMLKEYDWNTLPVSKIERSTNRKLKNTVDKLFKPKNIRYFK